MKRSFTVRENKKPEEKSRWSNVFKKITGKEVRGRNMLALKEIYTLPREL